MTDNQPWTIKRLLEWTKEYFVKHDAESPRLEAEVLLAEALECTRIDLYTRFAEVPSEPALGKFRGWVKRRVAGEPVAYLVGQREFFSIPFKVSPDVLIPRPETEHVVLAGIEFAKHHPGPAPIRIIDVGTGSGCVIISIGTHIENGQLTAVDISPAALEVAKHNADQQNVDVDFIESDLFDSVPPGQFDLIVSNPPYVGTEEQGTLSLSVREHEPGLALFSGSDGLDMTRRLIESCSERLAPKGMLVFETSPMIMDRCLAMASESGIFKEVAMTKDYSGHPRIVTALR